MEHEQLFILSDMVIQYVESFATIDFNISKKIENVYQMTKRQLLQSMLLDMVTTIQYLDKDTKRFDPRCVPTSLLNGALPYKLMFHKLEDKTEFFEELHQLYKKVIELGYGNLIKKQYFFIFEND